MKDWTVRRRWQLGLFLGVCTTYIGLALAAPRSTGSSSYNIPPMLGLILILTVVGLLLLAWWAGFYAWLQLDRYTARLAAGPNRQAFTFITRGIWLLAAGLILSSLVSATNPYYRDNAGLTAIMTQLNYYIIVFFPFFGFLMLGLGSKYLAVSAQAVMTLRAKLITVGPPVALLAAFYIFLAATNSAPSTQTLAAGPVGSLVLWLTVAITIGSWILGLLAALNVERATYRGEGAKHTRPLVGLYNGILTITGGFIILDALLSLGAPRLKVLPVELLLLLLYGFIGVIGWGFWTVAVSARAFAADDGRPER